MKKYSRKLICFILSVVMLVGTTVIVSADEDSSIQGKSAIADISVSAEWAFFYDAETDEVVAENGEPFEFEEIEFEIPTAGNSENESGISTADISFELYIVRAGLKKTANGTFTWWFNTDCPTSPLNKPNIKVTVQLQGNFTTGRSFLDIEDPKHHTYKTNAEYGADYTWTSTAKTGYYRFKCTVIDYDNGGTSQSKNSSSNLINKTGHVWNFTFSDTASGKSLPKPPANYKKGATYSRPSNLAETYYNTYKQNTGKSLTRSLYDIHHIKPLAYGGSNDYINLIHLPKATHKSVTSWWAGY